MTPYEVYFYSSGGVEERWGPKDLGLNRTNAIIGYGLGGFLSFALMIVGGSLFLDKGIEPEFLGSIAIGTEVPLGQIGLLLAIVGILFAVGGAAIDTLFSGAYNMAQFLGWEWGRYRHPRGAPRFTIAWLVILVIALGCVMTGVDAVQLKVVLRELRLEEEAQVLELRGEGLRERRTRRYATAEAPPEIRFPADVERQIVDGTRTGSGRARGGYSAASHSARAGTRLSDSDTGPSGREESGPGLFHRRSRLPELSFGLQHVLIRYRDLLFQGVQRRVVVDLPPSALGEGVGWLSLFPGVIGRLLLESRRGGRGRAIVVGSDAAAGGDQQQAGESACPTWHSEVGQALSPVFLMLETELVAHVSPPTGSGGLRRNRRLDHQCCSRSKYRYTTGVVNSVSI